MQAFVGHPRPFDRRIPRAPLAACLVAAAVLTFIVAPRASNKADVEPVAESIILAPIAQLDPVLMDIPAMTDLLVVGRGDLQPMEQASRLFPQVLAPQFLFPQAEAGMRALIASAATANDLPSDFFLRLLRQESGLNPLAVSPVGAQGIAQFMPGTAAERGLRDPFDPVEAIPKSAELLREHRARFGNLGLAAAAYNAGPQRVRGWLDGRSGMPAETRDYVVRITGRTLEDWATESGRSPPKPALAFMASADLGFATTWPTNPAVHPTSLPATSQGMRSAPSPASRSTKRPLQRPSARSQQPRSEQALCALLNGEGRTCLVQATY
ncbi:lytic transglycosylase domain-containing protein [Methylobacterium mesophilicum SR1.6/6]|uniref:Lytic transglycosylase domain-containing protein n=1 Tax=Methylobacterium mesophilicum SR1.6/6 TaxID=908290 RepID=A0A6B9FS69_9HYPH|nr:lytic transglycosylase domain-containing protein [Methylobacterium mesophilicum SR1.6/6]